MEQVETEQKEKQLVRLIYVSVMTEVCDTEALEKILKISRENNKPKGITGILCYDPAFFLQCLEGDKDDVNELYANIARDNRHKKVTLLGYNDITERQFGEWSMAFVATSTLDKSILQKYSTQGKFSPFVMNAKQAYSFLCEIVENKKGYLAGQKSTSF